MHQNSQYFISLLVVTAFLARAHRACHYRIHNFQVGRIKSEDKMQHTTRCPNIRRKTHVVFHIARAIRIFDVEHAFEFREQILG